VNSSSSQVLSSLTPPSQAKISSSNAWESFLAIRKASNKSSLSTRLRVSESELSKAAEKLTSETFDALLSKNKIQRRNIQVESKVS